ncbi:hypothetical protein [Gracilimonas mengyeensis]|nr:hypothetical protein [Gracilimonas mengyeensis]
MRQVKVLTDFLIQILTKKNEGAYEEAEQLIDRSIAEVFEDTNQAFSKLSLKQTAEALKDEAQDGKVILAMANILFEKIELVPEEQKQKASLQTLLLYKKALSYSNTAFAIEDIHKMNGLEKKFKGAPELAEITEILKTNEL